MRKGLAFLPLVILLSSAFVISVITYFFIQPKITIPYTSATTTTTTTSMQICHSGYFSSYRCSGNFQQQLFQQTDCSSVWINQQYCSNGCSNGFCLEGTQTPLSTSTTTISTATTTTTLSIPACLHVIVTSNTNNPFSYGDYHVSVTEAIANSWIRVVIKDNNNSVVDAFVISQGSSKDSVGTGMTIRLNAANILADGTIVGIDLTVSKIGIYCQGTSTTTSFPTTTLTTTTTPTIPLPVPIKSNYLVGAYWWPNWDPTTPTSNWFDWRDSVYHPILGQYDGRNITVIDYQIKWAVENGVSFFAVSFWEDRLQQGFFKADFLPYIKFAFNAPHELSTPLCTYSCVPDNTDPNIFATQAVYMAKYYNYSNYLKINGRPIIFIYIQPNWRAFTPSEESDLLSRIRSLKAYDQQNGINPYLIGSWGIPDGNFALTSSSLNREFDAIAIYSATAAGGINGTFDEYVSALISLSKEWHDSAPSSGTTFIPDVMVGVDDSLSYLHGTRNYWAVRPGGTPEKASQLLAGIKPYVNNDNKIFMISDWNDWTEGSALEPTQEWGFGYLQAVKQNFAQ